MKITICDDNIEDLIHIEKLLVQYNGSHSQEICEIEKFSDSNKLYKKIESGCLSDVYILDMLMPLKSGIDIGKQIRRLDKEKVIVYTTTSDDFALDAYGVQAVRYLLKPISKAALNEAIEYASSFMNVKVDPLFLIKTQDGLVSLPYSKISYIENRSRILYVYLTDGRVMKSLFIRSSFEDEIKSLSANAAFIQVHKSFVVNLRSVERLGQDCIVMEDGDYIPVSKKKYPDVKRRYLLFMADRYR